jgi:hypothetical protein
MDTHKESRRIHLQDVQEETRSHTPPGPFVCQTGERFRTETKVERPILANESSQKGTLFWNAVVAYPTMMVHNQDTSTVCPAFCQL